MSKVRDYQKLAEDILEAVGGEENVVSAARCATRLRLVLKRSNPKAKKQSTPCLASLQWWKTVVSFRL